MKTVLLWALWINAGGSVNGGYLQQPYISAYFETVEECQRVQFLMTNGFTSQYGSKPWARCIQANYVVASANPLTQR